MSVRATSIEAIHELNATGRTPHLREIIYATVATFPAGITRRELAEITRLPINTVAGRVNELMASGVLAEMPVVRDPITGRHAIPVTAKIRTEHCNVCQAPLIFAADMPAPATGKYYCSTDCERDQREQYYEADDGFY